MLLKFLKKEAVGASELGPKRLNVLGIWNGETTSLWMHGLRVDTNEWI